MGRALRPLWCGKSPATSQPRFEHYSVEEILDVAVPQLEALLVVLFRVFPGFLSTLLVPVPLVMVRIVEQNPAAKYWSARREKDGEHAWPKLPPAVFLKSISRGRLGDVSEDGRPVAGIKHVFVCSGHRLFLFERRTSMRPDSVLEVCH